MLRSLRCSWLTPPWPWNDRNEWRKKGKYKGESSVGLCWIELRETRGEIEEKRGNDERKRGRKRAMEGGGVRETQREREGEGGRRKREMKTFRRDGTRGIYAVGCRRRVDCEPRSINNDTTASATIEVLYVVVSCFMSPYSRSFQLNNLRKTEFALIS